MGMIEKVEAAIRDNIQVALPDGVEVDYRYAAVAALQAMRDKTEAMSIAMRIANMSIAGGYGGPSGWEAAIDAALKEEA